MKTSGIISFLELNSIRLLNCVLALRPCDGRWRTSNIWYSNLDWIANESQNILHQQIQIDSWSTRTTTSIDRLTQIAIWAGTGCIDGTHSELITFLWDHTCDLKKI